MKRLQYLLAAAALLCASACQKAMSPDEINDLVSSGVMLVYNQYYYSVTLPSGDNIYFLGTDEDGELYGLTYDEKEAEVNARGGSGTGFFISEDGLIMTNRHVAYPQVSSDDVRRFLKGLKKGLKKVYREKMQELTQQFYACEGDPGMQSKIAQQYSQYETAVENIDDMDVNEADIKTHTELGILYNGEHFLKYEDLHPCTLVAYSEEPSIDLAIIQLDDATTPEGAYIFKLRDEADDKPLTFDQKLYMIGYNYGFSIARTEQGIYSQIYSGSVTQKSDGVRILYSIPAQHGSSGSPVVDEYGNLVAVNYAGYDNTQSFNYGIPSKKIRQFLREY